MVGHKLKSGFANSTELVDVSVTIAAQGALMADNLTKKTKPDRSKIAMDDDKSNIGRSILAFRKTNSSARSIKSATR
jgi:hypothetical protein